MPVKNFLMGEIPHLADFLGPPYVKGVMNLLV
jgi:hypothetical protein